MKKVERSKPIASSKKTGLSNLGIKTVKKKWNVFYYFLF